MAGIYVHFPFCSARCTYCDFYSQTGRDWDGYVEAVEAEASDRKDFLKGVPPRTVYFGGGTPSLLPPRALQKVTDALRRNFDLSRVEEFTLEANPDDVNAASAAAWRAMGATRLSMGVQSFDDAHLKAMRRRHTAARAEAAFRDARRAGFTNISIDLIFGFTGLAPGQWDESISRALALEPDHISCYQMTGKYAAADEELCRRQYLHLQHRLASAGFCQYEVSNYCRTAMESKHNSAYWRREAYLGLGAAAHSFDGERYRCWNVSDIKKYISGEPPCGETLTDEDVFTEQVMLGLRTAAGVEAESLSGMGPLDELLAEGLLQKNDGRISIPSENLFISDWIISRLLG